MPEHGEERDRRIEHEGIGDVAVVDLTVSERWCEHCEAWIEVRGISGANGALAWMVHDGQTPGACPATMPAAPGSSAPWGANAGEAGPGAPLLDARLDFASRRADAALHRALETGEDGGAFDRLIRDLEALPEEDDRG